MRHKGDKGCESVKLYLMLDKHLLDVRGFKRKMIWIKSISEISPLSFLL